MAFCVDANDARLLSISLAVSAGVMIYVSFIEIFYKAIDAFATEWSDAESHLAATGFFFLGIFVS